MKYLVTVEAFDDVIEEEVLVSIEGQILRCFMPFGIESGINIGNQYYADIEVQVYDDMELKELKEEIREIKCINQTFAYYIRGKLNVNKNIIESTVPIYVGEDELIEHSYCDGKFVEIRIGRFNLEFIV